MAPIQTKEWSPWIHPMRLSKFNRKLCLRPSVPVSRGMKTDRDSRKLVDVCKGNDRVELNKLHCNLSCIVI